MNDFWNRNRDKIFTLLLFCALFLGFTSVIALVGGSVMRIFGFQYRSVGSLILFFLVSSIVSFPASLLAGVLPRLLLHLRKIPKMTAIPLYLILDTTATFIGMYLVDSLMDSVAATQFSIMMIAILFALPGLKDLDRRPKGLE